jgi:hypothetical protein
VNVRGGTTYQCPTAAAVVLIKRVRVHIRLIVESSKYNIVLSFMNFLLIVV